MNRPLSLAVLAVLAVGCHRNATPDKVFTPAVPAAGTGVIYVYRNLIQGVFTDLNVYVDDQQAGMLGNNNYAELKATAGAHTLKFVTVVPNKDPAPFTQTFPVTVADGQVSYLNFDVGSVGDEPLFKPKSVPAEQAVVSIASDTEFGFKWAQPGIQ